MAVNPVSSSAIHTLTQPQPQPQQPVKSSDSDGDKKNSSTSAASQQPTTNSIGQTVGTLINTTA